MELPLVGAGVAPGAEGPPEDAADQGQDDEPADRAELGEVLQVEGVGVVEREVDRAVLLPVELVGAGAGADDRLFAEAVDRDPPEIAPPGAAQVGDMGLRLFGNCTSEL